MIDQSKFKQFESLARLTLVSVIRYSEYTSSSLCLLALSTAIKKKFAKFRLIDKQFKLILS